MSDDAKWILGIGIPIVLALIGVVWTMFNRRLDASDKKLDERLEAIWDQIGRESDKGMRKTVHHTANRTSENGLRLADHNRRLEHLERKVFNGHRPENER